MDVKKIPVWLITNNHLGAVKYFRDDATRRDEYASYVGLRAVSWAHNGARRVVAHTPCGMCCKIYAVALSKLTFSNGPLDGTL